MRCLVCQNQSLADSNAGLAVDLKNDIYHMVKKGKTREQITQVMVGRYGEFVLFAPPLSRHSALLWFLPLLLLLLGALVIWRMSRRARRSV
jgi:cytochrome c-type biogenesis protein CcmH